MAVELLIRFIIGGLVVCAFAVIGDVLAPKRFAGIFGSAPSVALATLGLAFALEGPSRVSIEGRSMLIGAAALAVYSAVSAWFILRRRLESLPAAALSLPAWFIVAGGIWALVLR